MVEYQTPKTIKMNNIRLETPMESLANDLKWIRDKKRRKTIKISYLLELIDSKYVVMEQNTLKKSQI